MRVDGGQLAIDSEGNARKFVREVEHRTYSGAQAWKRRQPALYITERCVFRLGADGLELTEVAPGVDIERDILAQMDFRPVIRGTPRPMDAAIFRDVPMGLRERMLAMPLAQRFTYAPEQNIFFINFERLAIRTPQDIEDVRAEIERQLTPLGRKIYAIVNYDNFSLPPELVDAWTDMVKRLVERFYWGVTRYTTSGFLRVKLGDALARRGVVPHIYESAEEAHRAPARLRARATRLTRRPRAARTRPARARRAGDACSSVRPMARDGAPTQHGLPLRFAAARRHFPEETTAMSHLLDPHALHIRRRVPRCAGELEQLLLCDPGHAGRSPLRRTRRLIDAYEARRPRRRNRRPTPSCDACGRRRGRRSGCRTTCPSRDRHDAGRRRRRAAPRGPAASRHASPRRTAPWRRRRARLSDQSGVAKRAARKSMNARTLADRWRRLGYTALIGPAGTR